MPRIILIILIVAFGCIRPLSAQGGNVDNFIIDSFTAEYTLSKDTNGVGRLNVKEEIVSVFSQSDINHGILRAIPKKYNDARLSPIIQAVTDEKGRPYPYTAHDDNDNLILKIGDPGTYVHGQTTYLVEYDLTNVVTFYSDHDEFFWDVNGDQWAQPFGKVAAIIHIPDELALSLKEQKRCFSGKYGSAASNCQISSKITKAGVDVMVTAENLSAGENLSLVIGFSSNTFFQDPWPARLKTLNIASGGLAPVVIFWYAFSRWRKYGRDDPGRGIIVPQYVPPEGINPLSAGVILNERLDQKSISAAIIEMAIKKYVRIYEIKKKKLIGSQDIYQLELIKDGSSLDKSLQEVLKGIFGSIDSVGDKVDLSEKANKLYSTHQVLSKKVPKGLAKRGYFAVDPNKARQKWLLRGVLLMLAGVGLVFFGLTRVFGLGIVSGSLILMLFSNVMPARTKRGAEAKEHLKGLEDYIGLAEADRIKFLQSPEGVKQYGDPAQPENQIKLFEKLLPYAILFGVEKGWAREFKHLYEQPPDWYNTYRDTFTPVVLADSLSSFNSTASSAFSAPTSSGSSGFSGGGFSGGGGGGGGGGGW